MQSSVTQKPAPPLKDSTPGATDSPSGYITVLAQSVKKFNADENLKNRLLTHASMLAIALLVIGLSRLSLPWGAINAIRPIKYDLTSPTAAETQELPFAPPPKLSNLYDGVLMRNAVPRTIIPDRTSPAAAQAGAATNSSGEIKAYEVQSGDNISSIAYKFGLTPETVIWANPDLELNPDLLSVGQKLTILPVDGVYHQVGSGDTVNGIAATFQTDPALIINQPQNKLSPDNLTLQTGQWLIVPGGTKPFKPRAVTAYSGPIPADATTGTGNLGWPATGSISQGFSSYHPALDIAGYLGEPVLAADSGYVIAAGWDNTGYGYNVVIDHGDGFQTLYAHLQAYYVDPGANVSKGQQIGEMGKSGNATGPHLHFEIRHGTVQRNPYGFLP